MPPAAPHRHPRWHLEQRGLRPKKSFGQNFLHDDHHLGRIAALIAAPVASHPPVAVELGAGTGALTGTLLDRGVHLFAVERDRDLVPVLRERFSDAIQARRFVLFEANATDVDLSAVPRPYVLCGNLPYHLTSQILERAVNAADDLVRAVFLIQLEVADRLAASPGTKAYGALTVMLQATFSVERALVVPKGAFWPAPEVDGGVVVLTPLPVEVRHEVPLDDLRGLVRAAFSQRRKTLRRSLKSWPEAAAALEGAGVDLGLRPEDVDVASWRRAAQALPRRAER